MKTETLTPETSPEVGRFYWVPCVEVVSGNDKKSGKWEGRESRGFVPVIGPLHKDPNFGTLGRNLHFHIDGRFIGYYDINSWLIGGIFEGRTNYVIPLGPTLLQDYTLAARSEKIHLRRRKCYTLETGIVRSYDMGAKNHPYRQFYDSYEGKKVCKGDLCPHRKVKMIDRGDGVLECPLHGLAAKNGVIIPYE